MSWETEYEIMPMNFLCCLSLDLGIWCISVEEEVGVIDLPSTATIWFDLYCCKFYKPHIMVTMVPTRRYPAHTVPLQNPCLARNQTPPGYCALVAHIGNLQTTSYFQM